MSTSSTRICTTILRFTVLLCCWLHNVFAANVTVVDTNPSIVYSPPESWSSSSNLCSTCINPDSSMSYHEGINTAPSPEFSTGSTSIPTAPPPAPTLNSVLTSEGSSLPIESSSYSSPSSTPAASTAPPTSSPLVSTSEGVLPPTVSSSSLSPSPTDGDGGSHGSSHMDGRALSRQLSNYSGSVITPVTLSYNFTGTAIYLFTILPPAEYGLGDTPTNTNLSFTLDNQPAGNFSSGTKLDDQPSTNVLSLEGLSNQPHQLVVTVGENSIFIFDYLIYTNGSAGISAPSTAQPTPISEKKNNIATFAGALGGSVGVLSLFSLGIAISIIRRRVLAARRDRLDNEAIVTTSGPFVPRFFPDTIISPDPPNYDDALSSTNHNSMPLMASPVSSVDSSRQRTDMPPTFSLPPQLEELPPPPFPVPLSAPVIDLPADGTIPPISASNQTDLGSDSSSVTSQHAFTRVF